MIEGVPHEKLLKLWEFDARIIRVVEAKMDPVLDGAIGNEITG